jgi:hypothetical protein
MATVLGCACVRGINTENANNILNLRSLRLCLIQRRNSPTFSATPRWVGSIAEGYDPPLSGDGGGALASSAEFVGLRKRSAASEHKRVAIAFGGEKGGDGPRKNRIEDDPSPAVDENRFPSPHQRSS